MKGAGTALAGTNNASTIDDYIEDHILDPLTRLLESYRTGCNVTYTSAATVTVQVGSVALKNSGGTVVRMRKNTSTVVVDITADLDTGAEAGSTAYYVWAVGDADATTFTCKLSTSASFPTSVTYAALLGGVYNDGSSNFVEASVHSGPETPGGFVQMTYAQDSALNQVTATIAYDDSIPQSSEGEELMTVVITPTSTNSTLEIEVQVCGNCDSGDILTVGLFQDSTAGALKAVSADGSTSTRGIVTSLKHYMNAGTASATTFKVRAGAGSGNFSFNGLSNARKLGGVMASYISVKEYR